MEDSRPSSPLSKPWPPRTVVQSVRGAAGAGASPSSYLSSREASMSWAKEKSSRDSAASRVSAPGASSLACSRSGSGVLSSRSRSGFFSSSCSQYSLSSMLESCSSLIAWCNWGVMTSDCPCLISRRCPNAMRLRPTPNSQREFLAQIHAAHVSVADDLRRRALLHPLALVQDVGAVDDLERVAHIVVGDEHADAAALQMLDEVADLADRDRVDAGQ